MDLILATLGLAVAGLDPSGLLLGLAALAAGARERHVVMFALVVIVGTSALGAVLSLTVGQQLQQFDWSSIVPPEWIGVVVELIIAGALYVWVAARIRVRDIRPPRPNKRGRRGPRALLALAVVFVLSSPIDPTFVALVVLAGRVDSATETVAAHLVWILVSQLGLVLLLVAIARRRHARLVGWFNRILPRIRPVASRAATAALVLMAVYMTADGARWLATGRFLFE